MKLLITAPIRVNFSLNTSQSAYKTSEFYDFFEDINKQKSSNDTINQLTIYKKRKKKEYSYDDKTKSDLSIFGINMNSSSNKLLKNIDDPFILKYFKHIEHFEIKFFDNTVAIVDLTINLSDVHEYEIFTNECEAKVKYLIDNILQTNSLSIDKLLEKLRKLDKNNIIQQENNSKSYNDFLDFYKENKNLNIMWASCAIQYEHNDSTSLELIDYWLKDAAKQEEIDSIKKNNSSYSLTWLKYVFRENNEDIKSLWNTMFLAQYIYSVIDIIVHNLKLIISESYQVNHDKRSFLKNLFKKNKIVLVNQQLEAISEIAYLHITEYKDIKKFLTRKQLLVLNNILEAWTFDELTQNTEELLSTAKDRTALIYNKISTKNNFYTDILLTFIGFFAIIDLVLSFSQYSREYTADAMISSRGGEGQSFLYYLSTIPIDTFIGSGLGLSLFLLAIYFIYRQKILP